MTSSTVYFRPPKPPRSKKRTAPKPPLQEMGSAIYKYRSQLAPFLVSFWLWALAVIFGPEWYGPLVLGAAGAGTSVFLYLDRDRVPVQVPWLRLDRHVERMYAAGCAAVATLWTVCATWGATKPGARASLALVLMTCMCAGPWWHHRRVRGSIPVRFDGDVRPTDRKLYLEQARKLVHEWTAFTSAGHVQGARLRAITYNRWSVTLSVILRRGATVEEFTVRRLAKLESAFGDVRPGAARVERVRRDARAAMIRFMLEDPHAYPIKPPETGESDAEKIALGLFETGEDVFFTLVNTLIGGASGSGKSGVVNMAIRALVRLPNVALVGIDMKPGAPELRKWEKVFHALAKTPEEARDVLVRLKAGLEYRGDIMAANKWRKWRPTREQPFIVLIVDEVQELKTAKLGKLLDEVTAIIRAYGGCVVLATQHPIDANVSSTVKNNCLQKIGLRTEGASADRVIFGEGATRDGWRPSTIDLKREGSFLIRSPKYDRPLLARAYWLTDDEIDEEAEKWAPQRTKIDERTWDPIITGERVSAEVVQPSGPALPHGADIVDAEIISPSEPDASTKIVQAVGRGRSTVPQIVADTGLSRPTVYRRLSQLTEDDGPIVKDRRGRYRLRDIELDHEPEPEDES